jgi:hypothetical protein
LSILLRFCPTQNAHARNLTLVALEESYCKKIYKCISGVQHVNIKSDIIMIPKVSNSCQNIKILIVWNKEIIIYFQHIRYMKHPTSYNAIKSCIWIISFQPRYGILLRTHTWAILLFWDDKVGQYYHIL